MPVTPTYPGVYIEEIPSGVRTITGVATSITAFVGLTKSGPINEPITINSFGDYERVFGGLDVNSTVSYAVRDFYLNGGSQAIVVRLFHTAPAEGEGAGDTPDTHVAKLAVDKLNLKASSPGAWGNYLRARVGYDVPDSVASMLKNGLTKDDVFSLYVKDTKTNTIEVFSPVTHKADTPFTVDKVVNGNSRLVQVDGTLPTTRPKKTEPNTPPAELPRDFFDDTATGYFVAVGDTTKGSDSATLTRSDFTTGTGLENNKQGLYALNKADLFNLLVIPPYLANGNIDTALIDDATSYCERRRAFFIIDPPTSWKDKETAKANTADAGTPHKNAAVFFPRIKQPNPLKDNAVEEFVPSGAIAGVFARTDTARGVWKAPAGLDATLLGVPQLSVLLNDPENGELNPLGINCLRTFPNIGRVVWGSRTRRGADVLADTDNKYVPVRRLSLFIEESLYRGTQWAVFEPNDEPLWASLRLNIGAFMQNLFRQGAFQGKTPREAYFVKCDKETTTQNDINLGIVNAIVGFAPLKPAEFVILKIQQMAGQVEA